MSKLTASSLLSGRKWSLGTDRQLTYSFYENDVFNGDYYAPITGVQEVSYAVKNNVRNIFDWLEDVINIDFVEVKETDTSTFGQIRFQNSDLHNYAYAYYPHWVRRGGDVHLNADYDRFGDTNGFRHPAGKYGYMTLVHEIGHALGLQHTHEGELSDALDNTDNSVMTYKNTGKPAGTFMPLDVAALQSLYGVKQHNTGNTIYAFDGHIDRLMVNGDLVLETPYRTKQTIWDSGGIDTLDFRRLNYASNGYKLDINPGGLLSKTFSGTTDHSTAIAYDVVIENVINSRSNDKIYLNPVSNVIRGYGRNRVTGNDVIYNGNSQDTLRLHYDFQDVTQTKSNNHLILGLGNNGSIRLVNYYANNDRIRILYNDSKVESSSHQDSSENSTITLTIDNTINTATIGSYGGTQDKNSNVTIENDELEIVGNGWKKAELGYQITPNTVLTFDFRSTAQGEIHAIGFDNDNQPDSNTHFKLHGTQDWKGDIEAFDSYSSNGDWRRYRINVGDFFTGQFHYLTFVNDHDVANPTAMSQFRDLRLYESNALNFTVNGQQQSSTIESYGGNQDQNATVTLNDHSIKIVGNGWKKAELGYQITPNTVLTFDFRSTAQGEIHAIGFDNDNSLSSNTHFKLHGTQDWKGDIEAFDNYSSNGDWQTYRINVGDFFTGQFHYLTFVNDHDVANPTAMSQFRDLRIYEETTTPNGSAAHPEDLIRSPKNHQLIGALDIDLPREKTQTKNQVREVHRHELDLNFSETNLRDQWYQGITMPITENQNDLLGIDFNFGDPSITFI